VPKISQETLAEMVGIASAQFPARVGTPYSLMDAESRTYLEGAPRLPCGATAP
jgi:hypothetical protein